LGHAGQRVAHKDRLEELELLLAVQDTAQVEAAKTGTGGLVGPKRAGLQKRDRYRDSAHFLPRQFRVEVERIWVFDRAGELAHLAPIDVHLEWFAGFSDGALVGHMVQPLCRTSC